MIYRIFHSVERFDLRHSELCWEREVWYPGLKWGFSLLHQGIYGNGSSAFHSFPHVAKLVLDVSEVLLPQPFPYIRLIKDGSIAYVVPTGNPLIVVLSWGLIRIVLLSLTSFSFSVSFPRSVMVFSFFLRPLHLFGEFLQVSQQTVVSETEFLHLVSIGL